MARDDITQAFLQIYDAHAEAIFRHCFFRVYDRDVAQELLQESFTKAWSYIAEGKKVQNIRALVYKIANNLIIDIARKKKELSLEQLQEQGFTPTQGGTALQDAVDAALVIEKLQAISDDQRDIVYMRYVDGLTPKEIAEVTGLSTNVISVRIHRGVAELKKTLI